jgi:hypothetical protein
VLRCSQTHARRFVPNQEAHNFPSIDGPFSPELKEETRAPISSVELSDPSQLGHFYQQQQRAISESLKLSARMNLLAK